MKRVVQGIILLASIVVLSVASQGNDPPHNEASGVSCADCHGESLLSGQSPFWTDNKTDSAYNAICMDRCHVSGVAPFNGTNAPPVQTHEMGGTAIKCTVCHHNHDQDQLYSGRNDKNAFFVATGTLDTGAPTPLDYNSGTDTTVITYATLAATDPTSKWADLNLLAAKTDTGRGAMLVPNHSSRRRWPVYIITSINTGTQTITVKGNVSSASNLGVFFGQVIRRSVNYTPVAGMPKPVTFYVPEDANSFAYDENRIGTDTTVNAICQVCHTVTDFWHNDGTLADHNSGQNCSRCHPHTTGFIHGGGGTVNCADCHGHEEGYSGAPADTYKGSTQSHSTHTEDASDVLNPDAIGPRPILVCADCHDTNNYPFFKTGSGSAPYDLSETDVCDGCHSQLGPIDGLDDSVVGAKNNWRNGIYTSDGTALESGKERWCVTCHDSGTSVMPPPPAVGGRPAPDVAGDDSNYGFYQSGHGSISVECSECHGLDMAHIDGAKTYAAASDNYKAAYRLMDVGGNDPMNIPFMNVVDDYCIYNQGPTDFELCYNCHSEQNLLNDTRASGRYGCGDNPHLNAASITTTFREPAFNLHADHLIDVSGWQFIPGATLPKWNSDGIAGRENAVSCSTCHNPHGAARPSSTNPTKKMTVPDLDIQWGNDGSDYGQVGPGGNLGNVCYAACHAPNGGKYYRTHPVTELDSITVTDTNAADPAAAEAGYTNNTSVSVVFTLGGGFTPTQMRIAENSSFTVNDTGWIAYSSPYTYTLSATEGSKTVYAQVRDGTTTSGIKTYLISLDTTNPFVSGLTLTAPNGSETWIQNSLQNITWVTGGISDANLKASPVSFDYSTNSGASFPNSIASGEANDGSYQWTVPVIGSTRTRVKITATDRAGNQGFDTSASNFTIQPVGAPVLSSITISDNNSFDPAAADPGYTNSRTVAVSISASNNPSYMKISESPTYIGTPTWIPFSATANFTITSDGVGSKTLYVKLRNMLGETGSLNDSIILDTAAPAILSTTLTAPNGAEMWPVSSSQNIIWTIGDIADANLPANPVSLEYSIDSGASYPNLIAAGEANDGNYTWNPVPGTMDYNFRVRLSVTDRAGNRSSDESDGNFAVSPPTNLIVTTISDVDDAAAPWSLREAINNVNAAGGNLPIWFNISSGLSNGVAVISLGSSMNTVTQSGITIDAVSQKALNGDTNSYGPEVRIDGVSIFNGYNGMVVANGSNNVTVKGFQFVNLGRGIYSNADSTIVQGNHFGVKSDSAGFYTNAYNSTQVYLDDSAGLKAINAMIGGSASNEPNYFSCTSSSGYGVFDKGQGNQVINNIFGMMPDDTTKCANEANYAVYVAPSVNNNTNSLIQGNTIIGGQYGVYYSQRAGDSVVKGNRFGATYNQGTDTWTKVDPQGSYNIYLSNSFSGSITVGGPSVATDDATLNDSNVIYPNAYGIYARFSSGFNGNKIYGNFIGTNPEEDEDFGGSWYGIRHGSARSTRIGGAGAGEAPNVIANMGINGIYIESSSAEYVRISRNSFYNNGSEAALSDDAIRIIGGAQNNITRPTISSATTLTVTTGNVISGDTVEVYLSDYDGVGTEYGEGKTFIGSAVSSGTSVNVDISGSGISVGDWVTAIKINSGNDTSAFSTNVQVVP